MKASTPKSEIPRWPKTEATLNADGSGSFTLNGRTEQLHSASTEDARAIVLARVAEFADGIGRAVRLTTTDPDGEWELAVHPNGDVDELAARPRDTRPTRRAAAGAAVATRRTMGRRTVPRLLAVLAFLAVAGAFAVLAATTLRGDDHAGPTTVRADTAVRTTAQPATRTPAAVNTEQLALRAAQAGRARRARATAARKKAAAAQRSAAAHKRAVARRAARKKAVRKRIVARRVARRNAAARRAAARARANAPQRLTPSPTPSPSPPQSTAPPTPQSRPTPKKKSGGGEFDF